MYGSYRPRRRWLRWFLVYAAAVLAVAVIGLVIEAAVSPGSGQPQESSSAFPASPATGSRASSPPAGSGEPLAFRPASGGDGQRAGQRRVPRVPA